MFIIGITGGTGAGKTSALRAIETLGALVLDCDMIYHELLTTSQELKTELELRFCGVLTDGIIDRKRLGEIVWSDQSALRELNIITHSYVGAEVAKSLMKWEAQGGSVAAIEAIALIESGMRGKCDIIVGITAPADVRISRIMKRDGITRKQAEARISAQKPGDFFAENCDYLLDGTCATQAEFEEKCKIFFANLIGGRTNAREK